MMEPRKQQLYQVKKLVILNILRHSLILALVCSSTQAQARRQARYNDPLNIDTQTSGFNSTSAVRASVERPSRLISSPSYDIEPEQPVSTASLTKTQRFTEPTEFHRNLSTLKKIIALRRVEDAQGSNATSIKAGINSTIDDDINTINVLIGMLMLANRRLIEQRDRQLKLPIGPRGFSKVTVEHQGSPSEQSALTLRPPTVSQRKKAINSNKLYSKRQIKKKDGHKQDLILVKPGYDKKTGGIEELDQAQSDDRITKRQDPYGQTHMFLPDHRPLIARDLLNVERPPSTTHAPYLYGSPLTTGLPMLLSRVTSQHPVAGMNSEFNTETTPNLFAALARRPIQTSPQHHLSASLVPPYNGHIIDSWGVRPSSSNDLGLNMPPIQEQQRLEHEAEVRRRQEQVRRDHESVMLRQRLAHEQALARASQVTTTQKPSSNNNESELEPDGQQDQANNEEKSHSNDSGDTNQLAEEPEMKGFGNFVDTDFTDLFPPGILSDAEINEMKKQHQEQKRQQEQQRDDEEDENNQDDHDQQQQHQDPPEEKASSRERSEAGQPISLTQSGLNSSADTSVEPVRMANASSSSANQAVPERSRIPRPLALPNFLAGNNDSQSSSTKKTRRSEPKSNLDWVWQPSSDGYLKPYAAAEPTFDDSLETVG